jgi:hypothetical protein
LDFYHYPRLYAKGAERDARVCNDGTAEGPQAITHQRPRLARRGAVYGLSSFRQRLGESYPGVLGGLSRAEVVLGGVLPVGGLAIPLSRLCEPLRRLRAGEQVVAVGFPLSGLLSSDPIVTTGIISALSGLSNDRRTIQITAPVQPGNSGGPLLGENGSVVGVVVGKLDAMKIAEVIGDIPQNVNFAVSLGTLQSFLNANGVSYALDDSSATKSPADITAEASRYTVLLECLR